MKSEVSLKEKIGYGFGDAASSMFWKIFSIYLAIFYTDVFGISAAAAGTMFLVTRIWDTANDPIMGVIADRTNTRWGKFRPYLLWVAVPFSIFGVLMFTTPDFGSTGKLIYAYITYTLMMMVYTAVNVPYASLLGVMSANTNDRTSLASYRMIFAFGGGLLLVAVFQPLLDFFGKSFSQSTSYQLTIGIIGIFAIVFFLLTFSWTKERVTVPKDQDNNLKEDIKNLMKNLPWFVLLGASVMTLIFNSVRDGVAPYYFKYFITDEEVFDLSGLTFKYTTLFLFLGMGSNFLGVVMAKPISAIIGKRKTYIAAMLLAGVLSIFFYFCDKETIFFIFLLQFLVSFCAGIIFPLLWSMYADTADYSEWKTKRRATGLVFSASSMTQKLGWTIGGSVTMWLLAFFGFQANTEQTPEAIEGIKYMLSFVPGAAAILSAVYMFYYELNDKAVNYIASKLKERRERNSVI